MFHPDRSTFNLIWGTRERLPWHLPLCGLHALPPAHHLKLTKLWFWQVASGRCFYLQKCQQKTQTVFTCKNSNKTHFVGQEMFSRLCFLGIGGIFVSQKWSWKFISSTGSVICCALNKGVPFFAIQPLGKLAWFAFFQLYLLHSTQPRPPQRQSLRFVHLIPPQIHSSLP